MSRFPRWSNLRLRTKLTLLIEAAILVLGVATGLLATMRARATLEAELTRRGLAIAHDLAMFSVRPLLANDLAALRRFVLHTATQDHVREVSVLGPDGAVLMHNDLAALGRRPSDAATGQALASEAAGVQALWPTQAEGPAYAIFVPIVSAGARLGTVVMEYSHSAAETEIATARREIAWIWLAAMVIGGVLAFLLSSYITRPIARIAAAMQHTPDGEVRRVPDVAGRDEDLAMPGSRGGRSSSAGAITPTMGAATGSTGGARTIEAPPAKRAGR